VAGTIIFTTMGLVFSEDIFLYWCFHIAKGIASEATLRSVDGIRMEVVVAAGIVEFIGYGSNCFGFERSIRFGDVQMCGFANWVMTVNELNKINWYD